MLRFDLDFTLEAPESLTIFEIQIGLEKGGQSIEAGTVTLAHPRLLEEFFDDNQVAAACELAPEDAAYALE